MGLSGALREQDERRSLSDSVPRSSERRFKDCLYRCLILKVVARYVLHFRLEENCKLIGGVDLRCFVAG